MAAVLEQRAPLTVPEQDAQTFLSRRLIIFTLQDAFCLASGNFKYFFQTGESDTYGLAPEEFRRRMDASIRNWLTTAMFARMCDLAGVDRDRMATRIIATLQCEELDDLRHLLREYNQNVRRRKGSGKKKEDLGSGG